MAIAVREQPRLEPFAGIYTAPDAAMYLKATMPKTAVLSMDAAKIRRWIRTGVADPAWRGAPAGNVLIDFEDLVSMRVIAALRAVDVKWSAIKKAEAWLRAHTGATKPFATATLWHGAGDVYSEWTDQLIAASRHGQAAFELLRTYVIPVHGLVFDDETEHAKWWEPEHEIRLNPKIQFGSPCIAGTRVPTSAVYGSVMAGDSKESMPDDYGITMEQVEAALDWESRIRSV